MTALLIIALASAAGSSVAFAASARRWRRAHDRLEVEHRPHRDAVNGEPSDYIACVECEVRALRRSRSADIAEWTTTYEAMRAEIARLRAEVDALRCGDLHAFFDGRLDSARTTAFQEHLASCSTCAGELLGLMQQDAMQRSDPTRKR